MNRRLTLLVAVFAVVAGISIALKIISRPDPEPKSKGNTTLKDQAKIHPELFADSPVEPTFGAGKPLETQLCTQSQFESAAFRSWQTVLKEKPRFHNKQWEYAFILQALSERDLLKAGTKGLGFGVGREALPSVFATRGVEVLATDLDVEEATKLGWVQGNQHMSSIEVLNERGIATDEQLRRHVKVMNVDMNHIPTDLKDFDFTWSTCALGHLGNLEKGLSFIENSLATLKPGGIAVHTTEFNLTSDIDTQENENTSVYRKHDIQQLAERLRAQGHEISVNFNIGNGPLDRLVVEQFDPPDNHLRLRLSGYAVTSLGIVIRKNPQAVTK